MNLASMRLASFSCLRLACCQALALLGCCWPIAGAQEAALVGEGEVTDVVQCLKKATLAAQAITDSARKDHVLADIGLTSAASADIVSAKALAGEIKTRELSASVLVAIGRAEAKRKDAAAANVALKEAEKIIVTVDEYHKRLLLHGVVTAYLAISNFDEAARVAEQFAAKYDRAHAKIEIANARLAVGQREQARALIVDVQAWFQPAWDYEMSVWEEIGSLYLQLGDVQSAIALARTISPRAYQRCRSLIDVASYQAKKGNADDSTRTYAEAFQAAKSLSEERLDELHMGWVVESQAETGKLNGAVQLLEQMPQSVHRIDAARAVALAHFKAGDGRAARLTLDQAIALASRVGSDDPERLASLATAEATIGDAQSASRMIENALQVARQTKANWFARPFAFEYVAKAQIDLGNREAAEAALQEALRLSKAESNVADRREEGPHIAKAAISLRFPEVARSCLRELLLPTLPQKDDDAWQEAAFLLALAGDFEASYAAAKRLTPGDAADAALRTAAAYHAIESGPADPESKADKETDPSARAAMYLGIALGRLKASGIDVTNHYGLTLVDAMN